MYLDTSVLVTLLTSEARTRDVQDLIDDRSGKTFQISDWVIAEFSSALAMKLRLGFLSLEARAAALSGFSGLISESIFVFPVTRSQFRLAARFCEISEHGLRSPDSLHLAVCSENGETLCTLDQECAAAGPALGIPTLLL